MGVFVGGGGGGVDLDLDFKNFWDGVYNFFFLPPPPRSTTFLFIQRRPYSQNDELCYAGLELE